jgi:NADP-dependent 3-hydroxy acid dehydrogenase YdfG
VRVISEGLQQEVKPYNIRSTVISPGMVATELTDSITASDIAEIMRERYKGAVSADALLIASLPSRADQTNVAPADVRMTGHERGLTYPQGDTPT